MGGGHYFNRGSSTLDIFLDWVNFLVNIIKKIIINVCLNVFINHQIIYILDSYLFPFFLKKAKLQCIKIFWMAALKG